MISTSLVESLPRTPTEIALPTRNGGDRVGAARRASGPSGRGCPRRGSTSRASGRAAARSVRRSTRSQLRQLLAVLEVALQVDRVLEPLLGYLLVERTALEQIVMGAAVDDPP